MMSYQRTKKGHRGSFVDLMLLPFLLFGVAVVILVCVMVLDLLAATELNNGFISMARTVLHTFDYLFIVVAIGLNIFVILSAFAVRTHPLLFVMAVFFQLINVLMAEIARDVYMQLASASGISGVAIQFPVIGYFFAHLPLFTLIMGFILALIMYTRPNPIESMSL